MKPHPRIRKTVKWGGAVVTVLLVVVWIGSGLMWVQWLGTGGWAARLHPGVVGVEHQPWITYTSPGLTVAPTGRSFWAGWSWMPRVTTATASPWPLSIFADKRMPSGWVLQVPVWVVCLPTLGLAILARRQDALAARREVNLCLKCGYDRTGLAAGAVCPECGAAAVSV